MILRLDGSQKNLVNLTVFESLWPGHFLLRRHQGPKVHKVMINHCLKLVIHRVFVPLWLNFTFRSGLILVSLTSISTKKTKHR